MKILETYLSDLTEEESEYQKFFQTKLDAWKIDSPEDLNDEQKAKFFADVKSEWAKKKMS